MAGVDADSGQELGRRLAARFRRLGDRDDLDPEPAQGGQMGVLGDRSETDEADAAGTAQRPRLRLTASRDSSRRARPFRASVSEITSGGLMRSDGL